MHRRTTNSGDPNVDIRAITESKDARDREILLDPIRLVCASLVQLFVSFVLSSTRIWVVAVRLKAAGVLH